MPFSLNPILEKRRTVLLSAQLSSFPALLFLHLDVYYPPRRNRDLLNLGNQARTFSNSKVLYIFSALSSAMPVCLCGLCVCVSVCVYKTRSLICEAPFGDLYWYLVCLFWRRKNSKARLEIWPMFQCIHPKSP